MLIRNRSVAHIVRPGSAPPPVQLLSLTLGTPTLAGVVGAADVALATTTPTAHYSDGTNGDVVPTWTSGDATIATVVNGAVHFVAAGTVALTAHYQTQQAILSVTVSAAPVVVPPPTGGAAATPQTTTLPRVVYDPVLPAITQTITLPDGASGNDLQNAINQAASSGLARVAISAPSIDYAQIGLPAKSNGTGWVSLMSRAKAGNTFPKQRGQRAFLADGAQYFATFRHLYGGGDAGITTPYGDTSGNVRQYSFHGIHFAPQVSSRQLPYAAPSVNVGYNYYAQGDATGSGMPDEFVFDHCVWDQPALQDSVNPSYKGMTGIWWNAKQLALRDCDARGMGSDGAASDVGFLWMMDARGPVTVDNCGIECSSIPIFAGGGSAHTGPIPSDITIRRSYLRPHPDRAHTRFKNLVEFKQAEYVDVADCVMEGAYAQGQWGTAVFPKSTINSTGPATYSSNVTVRNCKFLDCGLPFAISPLEGDPNSTNATSARGLKYVELINVLCETGGSDVGGSDLFLLNEREDTLTTLMANGATNPKRACGGYLFRNVTFVKKANTDGSEAVARYAIENAMPGEGQSTRIGLGLTSDAANQSPRNGAEFRDCVFGNVSALAGGNGPAPFGARMAASNVALTRTLFLTGANDAGSLSAGSFPNEIGTGVNYLPASSQAAHFVANATGNYRFASTSAYYGLGLGCDHDVLDARTAHCRDGQWV